MAFKTVGIGGNRIAAMPKNLKTGDSFEGIYLGAIPDKFGGDSFLLKMTKPVIIMTKESADAPLVQKGVSVGEELTIIGGGGGLKYSLKEVQHGQKVLLTYNGTAKIKSGPWAGKDTHNWGVQVEVPDELETSIPF
jgi:hypothetical protein